MPKGYWISLYRTTSTPDALARYATLAGPLVLALGGRFLARAVASKAYEAGVAARTVIIEFETIEAALAAYENPAYREAMTLLGDTVERDVRIVEGVE